MQPRHSFDAVDLPHRLLTWYDRHARILPWRARPGEPADPYRVWLSEIMLQQTTVVAVAPYYQEFLRRWPTVQALAASDLDAVLHAWQGLGYYARARNLHRCAQVVTQDYGGRFPSDEAELCRLPGVGAYTAAAIAAIAFGRRATVVDGNVERVIARLFAVTTPLPAAKAELRRLAESLTPGDRSGDYAQAIMDLGATVCVPRKPKCLLCPWAEACAARAAGTAEALPAKAPKAKKPTRHGVAFWAVNEAGAVLLRRRPETGLLGGMIEVPSTDWRSAPWTVEEATALAPVPASWVPLAGRVRHAFTHFNLELTLLAGRVAEAEDDGAGLWCPIDRLSEHALPTVMKKIARHALGKS
ncbi:A/G-specific adenine glycosylase [Rhodospirillaceae bacterium SYSU D60014]|uniref:A/G-specific adenine glycosylase n=1 Tax=Virgifigura deserti TaxID=2268457 RepID=UPI000E672690